VHGQRGAYEAALINTPIADPERPLEVLRTVHSFDPCLACAVQVIDGKGRSYSRELAVPEPEESTSLPPVPVAQVLAGGR
jgi:Ni,Fe-hydrogenase I large subunit